MKKIYFSIILAVLIGGAAVISTDAQRRNPRTNSAVQYKIAREGVGIEGIAVGSSTTADVIKKFGKNYVKKTYGKYSFSLNYARLGLNFYYCQTDKQKEIFDIEIRAPYKAKTSKGIILGKSTLEEIYKIYGRSADGLEYKGVSFFYANYRGKKIVTVIDIVENSGIRQCKEAK